MAEGSLRLVDSDAAYEGVVQVYHADEWGYVCDDGWSVREAHVVCRQLGWFGVAETFVSAMYDFESYTSFMDEHSRFWMDNVHCVGTERTLSACAFSGWGVHNCFRIETVGVRCMPRDLASDVDRAVVVSWLAFCLSVLALLLTVVCKWKRHPFATIAPVQDLM